MRSRSSRETARGPVSIRIEPDAAVTRSRLLRVLMVHERYQQGGGEDVVADAEASLLREHGHEVTKLGEDNRAIPEVVGVRAGLELAARTIWSREGYRRVRLAIRATRPDVVHVHNSFPLLSPAVHVAARREGVPSLQTLHNYRLICPVASLFRDGAPCEDCVGRAVPWPGVIHACYRDSRPATLAVAAMLTTHRARGTWSRDVALYVALTGFARDRLVAGGLPEDRVVVKPNFLAETPAKASSPGDRFLYVGRLTEEKGVRTLVEAWPRLGHGMPGSVVGDGPLASSISWPGRLTWLGARPRETVFELMRVARAVVVPSVWYEAFPMTVVEAFAHGRPVIASRIGSLGEIVEDGVTGLLVRPGDPGDLARALNWAAEHPDAMARMGTNARDRFDARYSRDRAYAQLLDVYERAIATRRSR